MKYYGSGPGHWYRDMFWAERRNVDAAAKWLSQIDWQWFVTLTFPWNIRSESADAKLKSMLNQLEKHHRANLGAVIGKESRSRHDRSRVPWHFHLLIASSAPVSKESIEMLWVGLIKNRSQPDSVASLISEHVVVKPYNPESLGSEYCLKMMSDDTADWGLHRMDCFLPALRTSSPNHRTLRRQRRAAAQAASNATRS